MFVKLYKLKEIIYCVLPVTVAPIVAISNT